MNRIVVSIIVATFNAAKTLSRALDSVLNQSFQDWECIIVDGASKDGTLEVIKEYAEKDSRIRYISEPDKGVYDAFNKGWKMAKGEWIYYLGADDILLQNALKEMNLQFDNNDVIYGDIIFNSGIRLKKVISSSVIDLRKKMISHQCIFMRRSCIEKLNGFDLKYKISSDFALIQKAIKYNMKFKHVNIYVAIFKSGGMSSASYANIFEGYYIKKEFEVLPQFYNMLNLIKRLTEKFLRLKIRTLLFYLKKESIDKN